MGHHASNLIQTAYGHYWLQETQFSGYGACCHNYYTSNIYYNMIAAPVVAFLDSLAASALATVGLAFSLVAFLRISSIAWHTIFQALARHWHFASHFTRNPSRHRS